MSKLIKLIESGQQELIARARIYVRTFQARDGLWVVGVVAGSMPSQVEAMQEGAQGEHFG